MRRLLLFVVVFCWAAGMAQAQQNVVEMRRAEFKRMGDIMQAMKPVAESGGDLAAFRERIAWMVDYSRRIPGLFPPGSGEGMGETKALATIWSDNAGFVTSAQNLTAQTERLLAAANSGQQAAFTREFQATAQVCSACHRGFRAR